MFIKQFFMPYPFATCDCCGRDIPYDKPYLCITKSVEVAIHSAINNQDEAEVLDPKPSLTRVKNAVELMMQVFHAGCIQYSV